MRPAPAIGLAATSSIALAEDLSSATAPLAPGKFTTSAHSDEYKMSNPLSAGPAAITHHGAVIDWPANPNEQMSHARVLRQGSNGWTCMPDSRKASAQPDVRGRDDDEVVHGDSGREEAGHRSRWTVLHADGRREAGTGRNSGTRPQPGQRMVLYRPAYHARASGFSQGRALGHQSGVIQ